MFTDKRHSLYNIFITQSHQPHNTKSLFISHFLVIAVRYIRYSFAKCLHIEWDDYYYYYYCYEYWREKRERERKMIKVLSNVDTFHSRSIAIPRRRKNSEKNTALSWDPFQRSLRKFRSVYIVCVFCLCCGYDGDDFYRIQINV